MIVKELRTEEGDALPPSSEPLPGDKNMDDDKDAYSFAPEGPGMISKYKKTDENFLRRLQSHLEDRCCRIIRSACVMQ